MKLGMACGFHILRSNLLLQKVVFPPISFNLFSCFFAFTCVMNLSDEQCFLIRKFHKFSLCVKKQRFHRQVPRPGYMGVTVPFSSALFISSKQVYLLR